jgi:peptidoglycan/LPS O-acetylase OafA/YrhL
VNPNINHVRFDALDGLRGLAAIAVMLCHFTQFFGQNWFKNADAAVDLFFVLSGLVIVHSYGAKIVQGMTFVKFLLVRFVRLAPLNIMAVGISCMTMWLMHAALVKNYAISTTTLLKAAVLQSIFIPFDNPFSWPYGNYGVSAGIFPLNLPAWSLFYEMLAYGVCFFYIAITKKLPGYIFGLLCFGVFFWTTWQLKKISPAWESGQLTSGTIRVMGSFFIGALIYKLPLIRSPLTTLVAIISLFLTFYFLAVGDATTIILNVFLIIPILIWAVRSIVITGFLKGVCSFLGFVSFPLYILHIPVVTLLLHQRDFINGYSVSARLPVAIAVTLMVVLITGYLDIKIRKFISSRYLSD